MTATLKQLAAENEELRSRLEEAEDTLRAIRSGEAGQEPSLQPLMGLGAE